MDAIARRVNKPPVPALSADTVTLGSSRMDVTGIYGMIPEILTENVQTES